VVTFSVDDDEPAHVCAGPYFWHSASSADGEWIVADTNWPDQGIMLVHVPSGRYAPLVRPRSVIGHAQDTHPHPSFNRDASKVIFNSNHHGLAQVHICTIPDALKQELVSGELDNRRRA